jgi:hypothetical protein
MFYMQEINRSFLIPRVMIAWLALMAASVSSAQSAREVRGAEAVRPVFGPAPLAVSPRVGHILIQLVNAHHQPIDQGTVQVTVPATKPQPAVHLRSEFSL